MAKGGYWVADDGDSLGYPVGAAGQGIDGRATSESGVQARGPGYFSGRPGYEVRVLMASANVLARHGQQQSCEDVLSETREVYKIYLLDLQREGVTPVDLPGWRQRQIAAAIPVKGSNIAFRSDELLGVEVRSPDGEALGSVDDLALGSSASMKPVFRSLGTISRPRPTQICWCWTRRKASSTRPRT
jgi:hypothetical protein